MLINKKKIEEIHEHILYPVVRVRTEKAGGTGLIIYSQPTPETKDKEEYDKEYETYIVTCHHVVADAIKFIEKWSSIAKRKIVKEDRQDVQIEVFNYEKLSRCIGRTAYDAEIVAWNKELDIAMLRAKTVNKFEHIAKLFPKGKGDDIKLGRETVACGCSLGHEPLFTIGNLVSKHDKIENKEYWMNTANTIFGNSGGAIFLGDTYEYVGITARITALQLGFGIDVITWMGFFVPISSIYEFFDEEFLQFIYDSAFTSTQCAEMKEAREKQEEAKLLIPQTEKKQ
jgi:S1-C subfamily serine protease